MIPMIFDTSSNNDVHIKNFKQGKYGFKHGKVGSIIRVIVEILKVLHKIKPEFISDVYEKLPTIFKRYFTSAKDLQDFCRVHDGILGELLKYPLEAGEIKMEPKENLTVKPDPDLSMNLPIPVGPSKRKIKEEPLDPGEPAIKKECNY